MDEQVPANLPSSKASTSPAFSPYAGHKPRPLRAISHPIHGRNPFQSQFIVLRGHESPNTGFRWGHDQIRWRSRNRGGGLVLVLVLLLLVVPPPPGLPVAIRILIILISIIRQSPSGLVHNGHTWLSRGKRGPPRHHPRLHPHHPSPPVVLRPSQPSRRLRAADYCWVGTGGSSSVVTAARATQGEGKSSQGTRLESRLRGSPLGGSQRNREMKCPGRDSCCRFVTGSLDWDPSGLPIGL